MLAHRGPARAGFIVVLCLLTAACGSASSDDLEEERASEGAASDAIGGKPIGESGHVSALPEVTSSSDATCGKPAPESLGPACEHVVNVTSFDLSSVTCWVDTAVMPGAKGTLRTPCSGDGQAILMLGGMKFTGVITGGNIAVCAGTEFEWDDGCAWSSAQRIEGDPSRGLVFRYSEAPKPNQTSCASACTATANLDVQLTPEKPQDPR